MSSANVPNVVSLNVVKSDVYRHTGNGNVSALSGIIFNKYFG